MTLRRLRIVIAEDEYIVARDMQRILESAGHRVLATVVKHADLQLVLRQQRPDLALVDVRLVDGDAIEKLVERDPSVRIVIVSVFSDPDTLRRASALKVAGFVVKPFTSTQLLATVTLAMSELADPDDTVRQRLSAFSDPSAALSPREVEVVRVLVVERRVARVARRLSISPHTVRNHLKSIFAKLRISSQDELIDRVTGGTSPQGRDEH